jgi:hypothetical protein
MVLSPLESLTNMSSAGEEADQNVGTKAAFLTMMVRHGPTLQVLKLWNLLSFADVQALRQHCLDLREVHVRLQPTGHDVDDKILRLLGSLPRIGTIKLTLYNPYPSDEDNNNNISHQRLSLALTNRAMDLPRAQSIFKIILAANRAARPGIVPSLHCLRLHSVGDGQPWNNAERLLDWVGRSWMLERKFADVAVAAKRRAI